ncbi:hypothetical protein [Streptomyces sp. 8N706]|uniref:hypothetical protein n=1 Tax=Streptomyces sp. 8N706 TaxID=3457416 RepID=UPI003FD337B4
MTEIEPGAIVMDIVKGALAEVRSVHGDCLHLARPSGVSWQAEARDVRLATDAEALSIKVAVANHNSRGKWGR